MCEVWICGRWDGADWDLAEHARFIESARRKADKWRERGYKVAIRDERGGFIIDPRYEIVY